MKLPIVPMNPMVYTVGADKKAKAAGVISTERPSDYNTGVSGAAALQDSTRIILRRNPEF